MAQPRNRTWHAFAAVLQTAWVPRPRLRLGVLDRIRTGMGLGHIQVHYLVCHQHSLTRRIRTSDLCVPNAALYQAELQPVVTCPRRESNSHAREGTRA